MNSNHTHLKKHYLWILLLLFNFNIGISQEIEFPIEVFRIQSENGDWINRESRQLSVRDFNANSLWLYLQVNNLNNPSSMRFRIDNGNWQNCSPNWQEFPNDKAYGGLNGGFGTTKFTTQITGLSPNGSHTIEFEFNPVDNDETTGYRIVDLQLWSQNNKRSQNLITNTRKDITGANFKGPFDNAPNVAQLREEGRKLWAGETGPKLVDRGRVIDSKCTSCHMQNGGDLKYFNYSNKSIIARSNFHGLSVEEGEKIAQYIRDLNLERSENGRPWQPPYQPGPDAEKKPYEWAAGQGVENVLDDDMDMLTEMYGSQNPSKEDVKNTINNFNKGINIRKMRISLQFPDWNMWLPTEHPMDNPDIKSFWPALRTAHNTLRNNLNTIQKVNNLNNKPINTVYPNYQQNGVIEELTRFTVAVQRVVTKVPNSQYSGVTIADNLTNSPVWAENVRNNYQQASIRRETAKRSLAHWMTVKLFEVIQEFKLYDLDLGNIDNENEEYLEWPVREWTVFQNAPHIIGANRNDSFFSTDRGSEDDKTRGVYLSTIWYQMQLTLSPGNRRGGQIEPNDFAYTLQHVHRLGAKSGVYEPNRFYQNYLMTGIQRNTGLKPKFSPWDDFQGNQPGNDGGYPGWNMRELSPWRLYSTGRGDKSTFQKLPQNIRVNIQEAFYDESMEILESFGGYWDRTNIGSQRSDYELEPANALPQDGSNTNCLFLNRAGGCIDAWDAVEIDVFYTLLHRLKDDGEVSCGVFNRIRDWAMTKWTNNNINWPTCSSVDNKHTLTVENGTGDGQYNSGTTINITADNAPPGKVFDKWTGNVQNISNVNAANTNITMPNQNTTITATYKDSDNNQTFLLNVTSGSGSGEYQEGQTVNIIANTAPPGKVFDKWTRNVQNISNVNAANTNITMPNQNTTITATYKNPNNNEKFELEVISGSGSGEYQEGQTVNIVANTAPQGKVFDKWTGSVQNISNVNAANTNITMPNQNITITATYKDENPPNGTYEVLVVNGTGSGNYNTGAFVSVIANQPPNGMVFDKWVGDSEALYSITNRYTYMIMPARNITVTATYKNPNNNEKFELEVISGSGSGEYQEGQTVNIVANTAPQGKTFDKWTGNVQNISNVNAANTNITMPNQNITITATYKDANNNQTFLLNVTSGSGSGEYEAGETVTIDANTAPNGEEFDTWTGDIQYISDPSNASTSITMPDQNIQITATYKEVISIDYYLLEVISGTGSGEYEAGKTVTIDANTAPQGKVFDKWTGNVQNISNVNAANTNITMPNQNITITATYKDANNNQTFLLNVTSGSGSGEYQEGQTVTIIANTAPQGKVFDKWTGSVQNIGNVNAANTNITMPNQNIQITATYKDENPPNGTYVALIINGIGSGDYKSGAYVPVLADRPPNGMVFDKWIGDIEDVYNVNNAYTFMRMPSRDVTVTATYRNANKVFTKDSDLVSVSPIPTNEILNIAISSNSDSHKSIIQVFDVTGRIVLSTKTMDKDITIDTSMLPSGYYYLQVNFRVGFDKKRVVKKFTKN